MKTLHFIKLPLLSLFFLIFIDTSAYASTLTFFQKDSIEYKQYNGIITDSETGKILVFATLSIAHTNISTITNKEGKFSLKVPVNIASDANIIISFLGYKKKIIAISEFKTAKNKITLEPTTTVLSEVNIKLPNDAKTLVTEVFNKKKDNYYNQQALMTSFYRETIKKRRKNVSLAEAIVTIYKQPYSSFKKDYIKLHRSRKKTDYTKLDTLALKLQGGPYNPLYLDLMKYPEYMFSPEVINLYTFSFAPSTTIGSQPVYVVSFKQRKDVKEPLYYGKLFIDSNSLALVSATYNLNVEDKELTSKIFVKRKPKDVFLYPTLASYRVDYREKDGKWYYGYSNVKLTFKVIRKGKWFNSTYSLSSEMAITDWKTTTSKERLKSKDRLKKSVIISDEASGFSDAEFWGSYNVIEPEKSIESAIKKIKRQLKKIAKEGNS